MFSLFSKDKKINKLVESYTPRAERCPKEIARLKTRALQRIDRLEIAKAAREKRGASPESIAQITASIEQYKKQLAYCEDSDNR